MAGIFGDMNPKTGLALQGLGLGLAQLDAGRTPNLSPIYSQLQEQDQRAQMQEAIGPALEGMSPGMRKVLAAMPPALASQYIMKMMMPQTPKLPSSAQEFEYARGQGFQGSYEDWVTGKARSGATTVNVGPQGIDYGKPPPGTAWRRDANGNVLLDESGAPQIVYIKGSEQELNRRESIIKGATEAIEASENAAEKDALEQRAGDVVLEDIGRLRTLVTDAPWYSPGTGFGAQTAANVAGSNAADAKALAETIRGNIGFDRLQQMRDASPTGGALGQVSERELSTLQSVLGSLEQSQSEEQFLHNLSRLERIYNEIVHGNPDGVNEGRFSTQLDFSKMTDEELEAWIAENGG